MGSTATPGIEMSLLCDPAKHGGFIQYLVINPRMAGRPYRYLYASCISGPRPCNSMNATCRVDVTDGSVIVWHDPDAMPTGPHTFVPRPGADADAELDGVLLLDCLGSDGRAFFCVLKVTKDRFIEIARVVAPFRTCPSLLSTWVWAKIVEKRQVESDT